MVQLTKMPRLLYRAQLFILLGLVTMLVAGDVVASRSPVANAASLMGMIAFRSDRDGDFEIFVMDADGTNQTQLTFNTAFDSWPTWSPDGKKIVYYGDQDGDSEIFVMDFDGSNQTQLTSNKVSDEGPAWSPNGEQIAFHSDLDGDREIYVMDADGSNRTQITFDSTHNTWPNWSPNGEKIVFNSLRDGDLEIFVMDADGTNQTQLTFNSVVDSMPMWSPSGEKIAFDSRRDGRGEIYVMDADGSNQTQLTSDAAWNGIPTWSPNGEQITFNSLQDGDFEIFMMDADGSNPTQLTFNSDDDRTPRGWLSSELVVRTSLPGTARAYFEPATLETTPGDELVVTIVVDPGINGVSGGEILVNFPALVLEVVSFEPGALLGSNPIVAIKESDQTSGFVRMAVARQGNAAVPTQPGSFLEVRFRVKPGVPTGTSLVTLAALELSDELFVSMVVSLSDPIEIQIAPKLLGDADGNNLVDYRDLAMLGATYGKSEGAIGFDARVDFNGDGVIDYRDLAILGANYGREI